MRELPTRPGVIVRLTPIARRARKLARRRKIAGRGFDAMIGGVRSRALRRGMLGGDRQWQMVGLALVGLTVIRRLARPAPRVVWRARLDPGDHLELIASRHPDI